MLGKVKGNTFEMLWRHRLTKRINASEVDGRRGTSRMREMSTYMTENGIPGGGETVAELERMLLVVGQNNWGS